MCPDRRCGGCKVRSDRRRLLGAAGLLVATLPDGVRCQQGPALRILFDDSSPAAVDLVRTLGARFGRVASVSDVRLLRATPPPRFYVAIGAGALASLATERLNAPLLALLVSRQAFERIAGASGRDSAITAIYAEPAPLHQMRVIRALFRRGVTVGVLVSRTSASMADVLREAALAQGLSLHVEIYEPDLRLSRNLLRIADAAAVLAYPDAAIYSTQNLRELLEATYRRRQPVIGFSAALVVAGTLASAVSDADDLASQVAALAPEMSDRRLPPAQYPRYWRVAINDRVARSLDVIVEPSVRGMGDRP